MPSRAAMVSSKACMWARLSRARMRAMDFQAILDEIDAELRPQLGSAGGKVASYIPALARVSPAQFGIALRTCAGETAAAGDSAVPFSIQSMSKVFSLTLAIKALGE